MTKTTRWVTAALFILALMAAGCASSGSGRPPIDLGKIAKEILEATEGTPAEKPAPAKPRATLAFLITDEDSGAPIPTAFAIFEDGQSRQADPTGYIARELEAGATVYAIRFEAHGYVTIAQRFQLGTRPDEKDGDGNRQFSVELKSTKPKPVPEPIPQPKPEPPKVQPTPEPKAEAPSPKPTACTEFECVRQTAAQFPKLLAANTHESCVEFVQRVLELLGPDYGHVGKPRGQAQAVPRGFTPFDIDGQRITGVSHDAIKHRVTGQVVDIIGNSIADSPAVPTWGPVPSREGNPFVPAVPVR